MKSQIENAWEEGMGRRCGMVDEGLKLRIENAGEDMIWRVRWREEGALK